MAFKVMSRRCDQCLMDPENRIVDASRAADLVRQCRAQDIPFLCHKATMEGRDIACRGLHDATRSRNARMSDWLGLEHEEYDPDTLERVQP